MSRDELNLSLSHPQFVERVFEQKSKKKEGSYFQHLFSNEFISYSRFMDKTAIQTSFLWRNAYVAKTLANHLIDDQGKLEIKQVHLAGQALKEHLFSLGPNRHHDDAGRLHMLSVLYRLETEKDLMYALGRIGKPIGNRNAEVLIRETLHLVENHVITDADARRASLSALLTSLRQNVGSCFATAPAILMQSEFPVRFLNELGELIGTGRLKRIYQGEEDAVPLCPSSGVGELLRPFLLSSLGKDPLEALAVAPGLIFAFEAAGVLEKELNSKEKREKCRSLLLPALKKLTRSFAFAITPDALIKQVLLSYFHLTEEIVKENEEKPEITMGFALPAPPRIQGKAYDQFLKSYIKAQHAFKSITDNALLKAWEFTLASFSESKAEFAKWNFYASLGLNAEEPNGIGRVFYDILQQKIEVLNEEMEENQRHYDYLFSQAKYLEGRVPSTETEMRSIQSEYNLRRLEINRVIIKRDEAYLKGSKLRELFPFLLNFYAKKFRDYFQEVYDPSMRDVEVGLYDDTPAGFRLLYKHGRNNTSLWTPIKNAAEYIQALVAFFVATEVELSHLPEAESLSQEVSQLVTSAILMIKSQEFLESSFHRLSLAYKEPAIRDPLDHIDQIKRKPWAYISGGTMTHLVTAYFGSPSLPAERTRWVENPTELLAFYIDTLKELPLSVQKLLKTNPEKSLLAFSPTHAFLLKPGWKELQEAVESPVYTYTWIRDYFIAPAREFLQNILLDVGMLEHLALLLSRSPFILEGSLLLSSLLPFPTGMPPSSFTEHVLRVLSYERWVKDQRLLPLISDEIDSLLYAHLPLFRAYELKEKITLILEELEDVDAPLKEKILNLVEKYHPIGTAEILTAQDLKKIVLSLLMLAFNTTKLPLPFSQNLTRAMQKKELASPRPLLVADTNWADNYFGFVVSPTTTALEFWRFDLATNEGHPMRSWQPHLNGTSKHPWGIFTSPHEYGG